MGSPLLLVVLGWTRRLCGGDGGCLDGVGAHRSLELLGGDIDVDGVACPAGGVGEGGGLILADVGFDVVHHLVLGGVEGHDQNRVIACHTKTGAGVVGPSDVEGVGGSHGSRWGEDVGESAFGEADAVVVDGTGGAEAVGEGVAHEDVLSRLIDCELLVADGEKRRHGRDEFADDGELVALFLLFGSVGVVMEAGERTHDVVTFPESADDGTDFARETAENTLIDFTHSCKELIG